MAQNKIFMNNIGQIYAASAAALSSDMQFGGVEQQLGVQISSELLLAAPTGSVNASAYNTVQSTATGSRHGRDK